MLKILGLLLLQLANQASESRNEAAFRIDRGRLEVRAEVGGKFGWFLLDTAGPDCISPSLLSRMDHSEDQGSVESDNQTYNVKMIGPIRAGGAELVSSNFIVATPSLLNRLCTGASLPIDGVLGYPTLRQMSIAIDFDQTRIWFWGPGCGTKAANALFSDSDRTQSIPLYSDVDSQWPTLVQQFDCGSFESALDLGSTVSSIPGYLKTSLAKHAVLDNGSISMARPHKLEVGSLLFPDHLFIGGSEFEYPPETEVDSDDNLPPLVGWTALAGFHKIVIDLDGGKLVTLNPKKIFSPASLFTYLEKYHPFRTTRAKQKKDGTGWESLRTWAKALPNHYLKRGIFNDLIAHWVTRPEILDSSPVKNGKKTDQLRLRFALLTGPIMVAHQSSATKPDQFIQGTGYYIVQSKGVPIKVDPSRGPVLIPRNGARIVVVGGLPQPKLTPSPSNSNYLVFDPSTNLNDAPPNLGAYRLLGSGLWMPLPTAYDFPIHLPKGTEVVLKQGWHQVLSTNQSREVILVPPGVAF